MKKKDVFTLIICIIFISASAYFLINMVFPKKSTENTATTTVTEVQEKYSWSIEEESSVQTMDEVSKLRDYGGSTLTNIGRANIFGPLN